MELNKECIEQVALTSISAGEAILSIYENNKTKVSYKEDNSPITEADKAAHKIISEKLKQFIYPILSEEGKDIQFNKRKDWPLYWLVDPLDGTKEFINRNGEFTVNIALIKQGTPVFGIVYVPVKKWIYIGILGEGAWKIELTDGIFPSDWKKDCNLLPIKSINKKCFTVVGSRSHVSKDTEKYISDLKKEHKQLDFISMGSSLKLCLVAEGKADVYPRLAPTMEWDTAAGDAIARSAGCRVVDYNNGENLRYNKENLINPWFIVQR